MCGFLFARHDGRGNWRQAFDHLAFRGPDGSGTLVRDGYCLGHKRLTVLDLTDAGAQPMISRSGRHAIVFNGEIYNFQELAIRHGITLKSHCDTELLLELLDLRGPGILTELNGMFSFVLFDLETKEFLVARDRLGIKPLYYSFARDQLIFCSEVAPIRLLLGSTTTDPIGVRQYRKLRTFFRGHTIWKEISMFPAGAYYESTTGAFTPYWSLPEGEQPPPTDEELYDLVRSAVSLRMLSDVPVGCFLSGGLDSSIVASLMKRVDTWGVGTRDDNEFAWSARVAANLGMPHHRILVDAEAYRSALAEMVKARQEPLSVPNEVMLYLMSREAKTKDTVVLGGEGADELFFGYDRIFTWAHSHPWDLREFDQHYSYVKDDDLEILEYVLAPYRVPSATALDTVARFFQLGHLHGLLRRVDFASMFASLEARVPFVDHRLVERMAGVSFNYRMAEGEVKAPLKRVFRSLVPLEIINRRKVGFPVDLAKMLAMPGAGYKEFLAWNLRLLEA